MEKSTGFERIILLFKILNVISVTTEFNSLVSDGYIITDDEKEFTRIQIVYDYIENHFKEDISLLDTANTIGMTKSAFCKYLKLVTKKTFTQLVNDLRLGNATKLLIESDLTISEICFASGFSDLSNFYKNFEKSFSKTPKEFRLQFKTNSLNAS